MFCFSCCTENVPNHDPKTKYIPNRELCTTTPQEPSHEHSQMSYCIKVKNLKQKSAQISNLGLTKDDLCVGGVSLRL